MHESFHQVVQRDIDDFRRDQRSDEELIGLAAWASLAAARRVGSWLVPPSGHVLAKDREI